MPIRPIVRASLTPPTPPATTRPKYPAHLKLQSEYFSYIISSLPAQSSINQLHRTLPSSLSSLARPWTVFPTHIHHPLHPRFTPTSPRPGYFSPATGCTRAHPLATLARILTESSSCAYQPRLASARIHPGLTHGLASAYFCLASLCLSYDDAVAAARTQSTLSY